MHMLFQAMICWTSPDKVFYSWCNSRRILHRVSSRPTVQLWPVGAGQQTQYTPVRKIYVRNFHQRFSHMRTSFPGLSSNH